MVAEAGRQGGEDSGSAKNKVGAVDLREVANQGSSSGGVAGAGEPRGGLSSEQRAKLEGIVARLKGLRVQLKEAD